MKHVHLPRCLLCLVLSGLPKVVRPFLRELSPLHSPNLHNVKNDGSSRLRAASHPLFSQSLAETTDDNDDSSLCRAFSEELISALDLLPTIRKVAAHASTRRAQQALLALVQAEEDKSDPRILDLLRKKAPNLSSRQRRVSGKESGRFSTTPRYKRNEFRAAIANGVDGARREYELVAEATLVLERVQNVTIPPFLAGPDESSVPQQIGELPDGNESPDDFDDWLDVPAEEWSLEHIIQVEQVVKMILQLHEWACTEEATYWTPNLSWMARSGIDAPTLQSLVLVELEGAVEILRVRTLTDPNAQSSYAFQLSGTKYPALEVLRSKLEVGKDATRALEEEILEREQAILRGLSGTISKCLGAIDKGLSTVAQLDLSFARAAFGVEHRCAVPLIRNEGRLDVQQFVHPLLQGGQAVPIDLRLPTDQTNAQRALIISGPNGGGKTLAMKSFGLVAVLVKLGIPIPTKAMAPSHNPPRVDFFGDIYTAIGDRQNLMEGQSTFMAQLHTYSDLIHRVGDKAESVADSGELGTTLVLMDELGTGTEANAGSSIAQAILETLLKYPSCFVVATTHSQRLKTLSFLSKDFLCAAVLLEPAQDSPSGCRRRNKQPTYQLQYGVMGESDALGAAGRCIPPLPDDVLDRAAQLMASPSPSSSASGEGMMKRSKEAENAAAGDYIRALTSSLELQLRLANDARIFAEELSSDTAKCQSAMLALASAYDRHLSFLEQRAQQCYEELVETKDSVELVGETIAELRVVKKQVKSEIELLRDRGLCPIPDDYELREGESVVIVSDGELHGTMAAVVDASQESPEAGAGGLGAEDVAVIIQDLFPAQEKDPSFSRTSPDGILVFKRYELAMWDATAALEQDDINWEEPTSYPDSKRRLRHILTSLSSKKKAKPGSPMSSSSEGSSASATSSVSFRSSRERKAAAKSARKQGQRKRKRQS